MKMGMGTNDFHDPFNQSPGKPEQHQVIRTKTLGRTEGDVHISEYKKIADKIARQEADNKSDDDAKKAINEILDKASEMRHLKHEVIEDADIVQVSVIRTADGSIVRKVPPDRIISFVKRVKEKKDERMHKLDIRA